MSELLTVLGTLGAGWVQKNLISKIPNNMIPFINTIAAAVATVLLSQFGVIDAAQNADGSAIAGAVGVMKTAAGGGVLGLLSTGLHQAVKILGK